MARYKVIQDIESEDKLLGPLTLKSFVYALIAGALIYINFRLLLIGSPIKWLIIMVLFCPMVLFGVLAAPLGREQPTEVWLLSKIRFMLTSRVRLWQAGGSQDLVRITVPKKTELNLTKNLSKSEVQSRLKTLALTLDTRGWAVKNINVNLNDKPVANEEIQQGSDRLVTPTGTANTTTVVDIHASDDILDEQNNATAQKFATMMKQSDEDRKKQIIKTITQTKQEAKPIKKSAVQKRAPVKSNKNKPVIENTSTPVTAANQAVNMELAQSGSAFSVATLAQLANRQPKVEQISPNEVSITLH